MNSHKTCFCDIKTKGLNNINNNNHNNNMANLFILQIVSTPNRHVTVHSPETLVRDDTCVSSAHPAGFLTRVDVVGAEIGQTRNLINEINNTLLHIQVMRDTF